MFRQAAESDLAIVASWIRTPQDCAFWAGPDFPYPASVDTYVEKLQVRSTTSVCLVEETLVAFGQLADKGDGRAHLGKIIVAPTARKKGHGQRLVRELLRIAAERGFRIVGLNVQVENEAAIRMYNCIGFQFAERPSTLTPAPEALYMTYALARTLPQGATQ